MGLLLFLLQAWAAVRVLARLVATARGPRIGIAAPGAVAARCVSVLVPVLDEEPRLPRCLEGLVRAGPEVAEIVVVDGGSVDGTVGVVETYARRDPRVRLVHAGLIPADWNGKARGLQIGLERSDPATRWLLTIDADVAVEPALARSLVAYAEGAGVRALSAATLQVVSGPAEGLVHPALLATLVYRFGIPGGAPTDPRAVQANGQCFLVRRDVLQGVGGFAVARQSLCEDVTLARALAVAGVAVGFYETAGLARTTMYGDARQALAGWSRSLPMRDEYSGGAGWLGLLEITLAQALPLPVLVATRLARGDSLPRRLNGILLLVRLGVLWGTARAYPERPWTYWLSPLFDLPVVLLVLASALRRRHTWRGRIYEVRGGRLRPVAAVG